MQGQSRPGAGKRERRGGRGGRCVPALTLTEFAPWSCKGVSRYLRLKQVFLPLCKAQPSMSGPGERPQRQTGFPHGFQTLWCDSDLVSELSSFLASKLKSC